MSARAPLVSRQAIWLGFAASVIAAVAVTATIARDGWDGVLRSDAQHFLRVAEDPFGDGSTFAGAQDTAGPAYRYGRPMFPLVAWLLAFARPGVVRTSLATTYVLSFGLLFALACELVRRRGTGAERGVMLVLIPSLWFTVPLLVSEVFVTALVLLLFLFALEERRAPAFVTAAVLLLAREAAVLAILPLAARDYRRRGARAASAWLLTAVPLLAWWVWVRARVGEWPFLDPAQSRREALGVPVLGPLQVVRDGQAQRGWFAFAAVVAAATILAGIWVWRRRPWWPVTQGALLFALLVPFFGPFAWRLPGEAVRLMMPAQALIAIAALARPPADPAGPGDYSV